MAAQKITTRAIAKLDKIGEQVIFDVYTQTRSVLRCIEALNLKFSKQTFYRWLDSEEGRRERWNMNMETIGQDLVEEALEIAHSVNDKEDVPAARLKVETNRWTATKYDRSRFGDSKDNIVAVQVNVSPNETFLGALEELERIQDAEIVEEEE
jgi:hypothetical protein